MAGKEAVFLLVDVGKTMHDKIESIKDSKKTRLGVAIDCMKEYVQQKLFNSKQTHIGIILFGINPEEDGDDNTLYIQEIEKPDYSLVGNIMDLNNYEVPERDGGDIFDALDKTIATVDEFVGKKKFSKSIFVFTNAAGETNYNQARLNGLIKSAQMANIKINVTALDFMADYEPGQDPEDLEFKEDPKQSDQQNQNMEMLYQIKLQLPNSIEIFPTDVAIGVYSQFKTKQTTSRVSFRGTFEIFPDLIIDIELYKKSNELKMPSLKKYSTQVGFNPNVNSGSIQKDVIDFQQDDPQNEPVDPEQVIKGYYYGRQLVPITKTFEEQMQYTTQKGLKLIGFTSKNNISRHMFMKDVECMIPVANSKSQLGLASLIKSCHQLKKVAIVRYCFREKTSPRLCALYPHFASNYECFYMCELPTDESIRDYQFNSLVPSTDEQQQAVADLIDNMDLMKVEDEDGDEEEVLQIKNTYNPTRQYFFQSVMHRAFQQNQNVQNENNDQLGQEEGLPEVNEVINSYLRPEGRVYEKVKEQLEKVQEVFQFEEKELGLEKETKVFWKNLVGDQDQIPEQLEEEQENQLEEQEIQGKIADIKKGKFAFDDDDDQVKKVSEISPIEDFRKMVENKKEDLVEKAITELTEVIQRLVENSFQGSLYKKAIACIQELRKTSIKEEEVDHFNDFLKKLKTKYSNKQSQFQQFWKLVVKEGITLILQTENDKSKVTLKEAIQFNNDNLDIVDQISTQQQQQQNNYDDLEDEID